MNAEAPSLARRAQELLQADAICLCRIGEDGAAIPLSCAPPGLLTQAFSWQGAACEGLELERGPQARRLLPLALRGLFLSAPGQGAVVRACGPDGAAFLAFWSDPSRVPDQVGVAAEFVRSEWKHQLAGQLARERLRDVSSQLRSLAFALPQGVVVVPLGQRPGLVNGAAANWLRLAPGPVEGKTLAAALQDFLAGADNFEQVRAHVDPVWRGETQLASGCIVHMQQGRLALAVTLAPIQAEQPMGWVWLIEDVTTQQQ